MTHRFEIDAPGLAAFTRSAALNNTRPRATARCHYGQWLVTSDLRVVLLTVATDLTDLGARCWNFDYEDQARYFVACKREQETR